MFILLFAASKYSPSSSTPIKRLSSSRAATPVEPTPINGSKTMSFLFVAIPIIFFNMDTGFWAGCLGELSRSGRIQIGLSMKLCISFCDMKFHVCFLFQQVNIISQLFRKPALKIFGAGFVLCHTIKLDVSNLWSRQLYQRPNWLYDVKINRFPVGFRMRINSSAHSSGLKSIISQSATSLFIAERPGKGILPVEC